MFLSSVIQHVLRIRATIFLSLPYQALSHFFPDFIINRIEVKHVSGTSVKICLHNFYSTKVDIFITVYRPSCSMLLLLSELKGIEFSQQIFGN